MSVVNGSESTGDMSFEELEMIDEIQECIGEEQSKERIRQNPSISASICADGAPHRPGYASSMMTTTEPGQLRETRTRRGSVSLRLSSVWTAWAGM